MLLSMYTVHGSIGSKLSAIYYIHMPTLYPPLCTPSSTKYVLAMVIRILQSN